MSGKRPGIKTKSISINSGSLSARKKNIIYLLVLVIWTVIVYSGTFKNGFVLWDDNVNILENKIIQDFSVDNILNMFSSFNIGMYQPVTTLIWGLAYLINGLNPVVFHSISLLFHLVNVILVFYLARFIIKNDFISFLIAVFHAVHPMHTESVAWISETKDVVYSCFFLLSLISYIRYLEKPQYRHLLFSLFCFVISCFSKSSAVTLPVILVLLDYFYKRKLTIKNLLEKLPFFLAALVFGLISVYSQKYVLVDTNIPEYSLSDRLLIANYSALYYLIHFFVPANLSAFHPFPVKINGNLPLIYNLSLILSVSFITLILMSGKYKRNILSGALFFLVTISVTLQVIPFGKAMLAERYTYIPYLGILFVPGLIFRDMRNDNRPFDNKLKTMAIIVSLFLIAVFSFMTYNRNLVWKNTEALFSDVTKKYPDDATGFRVLGTAYNQRGDYRNALHCFSRAIEIDPGYYETWYNRALVKAADEDMKGALDDYSKCIALNPRHARSYNNRGNLKAKLKDYTGALSDFNTAIVISPWNADTYNNRGNLKAINGDMQNALIDFNEAIRLDSSFAQAYSNRGNVNAYFGDYQGAIIDYRKALAINPNDKKALHNLEFAQKKLLDDQVK